MLITSSHAYLIYPACNYSTLPTLTQSFATDRFVAKIVPTIQRVFSGGGKRGGLRVRRNKQPLSSGDTHTRSQHSLPSSLGKVKMLFLPVLLRTVLPHTLASDQLGPNQLEAPVHH